MGGILVQSAGRPGLKQDLLGHGLRAYRRQRLHTKIPRANFRYKLYTPVLLCGILWVEWPRVQIPAARMACSLRGILNLFLTIF